jgi:hypothetical protein
MLWLAQASTISEEVLKFNPDAIRVVFNKFYSAISFKPTVSTILTPEVRWSCPARLDHAPAPPCITMSPCMSHPVSMRIPNVLVPHVHPYPSVSGRDDA